MDLKFNSVLLFILCAVLHTSTARASWYDDEEAAYDNSFDRIPTIVINTEDGFKRVPSPSYRQPEWVSSAPNPYKQYEQNWKRSTDGRYPRGGSPFNYYDESFRSPLVGQEDYRDVYRMEFTTDEEEEDYLVGRGTKYLKRSVSQAIEWARRQIHHPSQSWYRLCQSFVRQAYGVPGWADSAIIAWNKIPNGKKHIGGSPSSAPRGAALYYSGGQWGHVALASRTHALSNDYKRRGKIDYAPRGLPAWRNFRYLGWSMWTPYGEMRPYT